MKQILTLLLLLLSAAAFGQSGRLSVDCARADSLFNEASKEATRVALLRTAIERAAAEATAQCASELARIIDCSTIEKLYDKPRVIYVPSRYPVLVIILTK